MILPEVINNFNVYDYNSNKLVGVSGEVSLAEIAMTTATISGAGLLGDMDMPVIGQIGAIEQTIPFNTISTNIFTHFKLNKSVSIVLRGDIQSVDSSTGKYKHSALRLSYRGYVKKITPGKVKAADTMGASVTMELTYMHIQLDGETVLKFDKLNGVFEVDGEDLLAEISKNC